MNKRTRERLVRYQQRVDDGEKARGQRDTLVRELCDDKGHTQVEVAEVLGISRNSVQKIVMRARG